MVEPTQEAAAEAVTEGGKTQPKSPWRDLLTKALLGLGVLQLYNIVAYRQDIIDLSESIKLIAGWWRYWLGELFGFLHLHLPPLEREFLALILIFGSAANIAFYRRHKRFLPLAIFRPEMKTSDYLGVRLDEGHLVIAGWAIFNIVIMHMVYAIVVALPEWVGTYLLWSMAGLLLVGILILVVVSRVGNFWSLLLIMAPVILGLPLVIIGAWLFAIPTYYRPIVWTCRYLIVLLVADIAIRYLLEPILPLLIIPEPPPPRP